MSDESSRSTRPSGQRRDDGAPAWWGELARADLPADQATPAQRRWYEGEDAAARPAPHPVAGTQGVPSRRRAWIINALVALAALVALVLALGLDSSGNALVVGMIFGVPLMLVAVTALVVARRTR